MGQKLESKKNFAALCGVSAPAVTQALRSSLAPALVGDRIDVNHPAAQKYLAKQTAPRPEPPASGIDPLFEQALAHCQGNGRFTASSVMRGLSIGYERAVRIHGQLQAAGHSAPPPPVPSTVVKAQAAPPPPRRPSRSAAASPTPRVPRERKVEAQDETCKECGHVPLVVPEDLLEFLDWPLRDLMVHFGTGTRFYDWLRATKEMESVEEKRIKNAQSRGTLVRRELVEVGVIDVFNSAHVRLMRDGGKSITNAVLAKHVAGSAPVEIEKYVSGVIGSFIAPIKDKITRNLANVAKLDD